LLKYQNRPISNGRTGKVTEGYSLPLLFAPGTAWEYGCGIDWAGVLVSRATNLTLSAFLSKNVFEPLGMSSCTFRPLEHPSIYNKVMSMAERDGPINPLFGTTLAPDAPVITSPVKHPKDVPATDDFGGAGCFSSAPDYAKLLHSIMNPKAKQILSPTSIDAMFQPQLGAESKERLAAILSFPEVNNSMGGLPDAGDGGMDWGIGGQMIMKDVAGKRKKGTMFWGGLPNLFWWMDRESKVSGIFATQILPTGDPKCCELMTLFEGVVYEAIESKGGDRYKEKL
jgi:CubicO group peptidase (beta-lactamase class C family)